MRTYLAWKSIDDDKANLTLDAFQVNQIATKRKEADDTVTARIPEAYQWLLVPDAARPAGAGRPAGDPADRVAARWPSGPARSCATTAGSSSSSGRSPCASSSTGTPRSGRRATSTCKYLWELFSTYVYLPRLRDVSVLTEAVRDGASGFAWRDSFAYAVGQGRGRAVPRARHGRRGSSSRSSTGRAGS